MTLIRNKSIKIAHVIKTDDTTGILRNVYAEPFELWVSLAPVSGDLEVKEYGDRVFRMLRTVVDYRYLNLLSENDEVWIYDQLPAGSDYKIVGVRPGNFKITVYFERKVTKCVRL